MTSSRDQSSIEQGGRYSERRELIPYARQWIDEDDIRAVVEAPEFQALMAELKPRWEALIEWERGLSSS